jgi:predicted amidohydrolase YtcJ
MLVIRPGRRSWVPALCAAAWYGTAALGSAASAGTAPPATLILRNAEIWTVDDSKPTAHALAIRGNRIAKVGEDADVTPLQGPKTRVLDLHGAFVLPGFIDAHTHFGNAAESFFEVRLVDVNAQALLLERLQAATREVPKGMWITGFGWGSAAAVAAKKRGDTAFQAFTPTLAEIDRITPDHPVLLRRYDGVYFINSKGYQLARIDRDTPDPPNGEYVKDPRTGELTGLLLGTAGERMAEVLPPPSRARDLIGARAMLRELNQYGITSIHDIARVDEISQQKIFWTAVERSTTDLGIFQDLKARHELTVRVYPILTLANWRDYVAYHIKPGAGDDLIRYGALKLFIDGFMMSQPYNGTHYSGGFSFRVLDPNMIRDDIVGSDALGFDSAAHVTGDLGQKLLLDWYEKAVATNPARDRRFRIIHAWYPASAELERAGKIHAIVDIQPYHLIRELNGIEERLGPDRARFAFPWRAMIDHGLRVDLSSDWPGSYDRNNIAPVNPLENIYYAVTRQRLDGTPAGGFHPEQALTVDEAIRGYTINPAYASREEAIKGSIAPGKLADVVVLSKNIRAIPAREIPTAKVRYTIFDGKIIYTGDSDER